MEEKRTRKLTKTYEVRFDWEQGRRRRITNIPLPKSGWRVALDERYTVPLLNREKQKVEMIGERIRVLVHPDGHRSYRYLWYDQAGTITYENAEICMIHEYTSYYERDTTS